MRRIDWLCGWKVLWLLISVGAAVRAEDGPFQATGFKVGEVTDTTAIVWTRLTRSPGPNPSDAPMVEIRTPGDAGGGTSRIEIHYPDGATVDQIRHAVPGRSGEVRVAYSPDGESGWIRTPWRPVDESRDFTRQFLLTGLRSDARYVVRVESRIGVDGRGPSLEGSFRTAPAADVAGRVVFTVSTGQQFRDRDRPDGFEIYPRMLVLDPSFFVHTGDIVYYDRLAKDIDLARYHWQRTYSLATNVEFHTRVGSYFIKDDHDTWINDCWPAMKTDRMHRFTFAQGQAVFREQVPMGERTYRTRRWGKDLQVWLVEGRDFRSPNDMPDGPDKTIWGAEQMEWFQRSVRQSDATFRILISPTPVVGPDRTEDKHDNHSNVDFQHEGDELRKFIAGQENMVVVCGDRHWQYMSIDPVTGVREYSCGPASDRHAGGWQQSDFRQDYHRYLNVIGASLSATVERLDQTPTLTFRYHDVNGAVQYEDRLVAN